MTFEEWHEENFGEIKPDVPYYVAVLKHAFESGVAIGLKTRGEPKDWYSITATQFELLAKQFGYVKKEEGIEK
jgi:hypothetical protein